MHLKVKVFSPMWICHDVSPIEAVNPWRTDQHAAIAVKYVGEGFEQDFTFSIRYRKVAVCISYCRV